MSRNNDSLTIRDAVNPIEIFRASDGYNSMRVRESTEIVESLCLDPDMTVGELKQIFAIADRAFACKNASAIGVPIVGDSENMLDYIVTGKPYDSTSENSDGPA